MFGWHEPLGRAIRTPLRLLPKTTVVPVLSGPNRGLRWTVGSSTHGCWLGSYERANAILLRTLCGPGMTVFDVGANTGYFTLLFSRGVGSNGTVFAFEPDPSNLGSLRRNLSLNAMTNVSVVPVAVTDKEGETRFECASSMGHVSEDGALSVKTCRLDDFPSPDLIKVDIEGGELVALYGAQRLLGERRATWFIELHGGCLKPCSEMLLRHGYCLEQSGPNHLLARPGQQIR